MTIADFSAARQDAPSRKSPEAAKGKLPRAQYYGYLFVFPFFLFLTLFVLIPMLGSLAVSFTRWDQYTDLKWIGLQNYIEIFRSGMVLKTLLNTMRIMLIALPAGILLSLALACIINSKTLHFSTFFKTTYFLPYITTPVAIGLLFSLLFDYRIGFVNTILLKLGLIRADVYWLAEPSYVVLIVGLMVLWRMFGYNMLLYLAGLQAIPADLYEAAEIDGASAFQRFRYISIPQLHSTTLFVVITSLIAGFQIFDEPVMLMSGANSSASLATSLGGPQQCVLTLVSYIYDEGFVLFRAGRASAVAYVLTFFIAICSFLSLRLSSRGDNEL